MFLTIRADEVRVGDYLFAGDRTRGGDAIHPAFHWTRVTGVFPEDVAVDFSGRTTPGVRIETASGWYTVKINAEGITVKRE